MHHVTLQVCGDFIRKIGAVNGNAVTIMYVPHAELSIPHTDKTCVSSGWSKKQHEMFLDLLEMIKLY